MLNRRFVVLFCNSIHFVDTSKLTGLISWFMNIFSPLPFLEQRNTIQWNETKNVFILHVKLGLVSPLFQYRVQPYVLYNIFVTTLEQFKTTLTS